MARAKMLLRRIGNGKIYRAASAGTVRRLLPQQQSPRCVPVLIISDESCSVSRIIPESTRGKIREVIDALIKALDQYQSETLELWMNKLCDGLIEAGKGNAGRFRLYYYRKLNLFSDRRPRYRWQIRSSEKRFAEWYREGPPNDKKICHTVITAA